MPLFKDFNFISSTGKNSIHARMCTPDAPPRAIIQISHGVGDHIARYDEMAEYLAGNARRTVEPYALGNVLPLIMEQYGVELVPDEGEEVLI